MSGMSWLKSDDKFHQINYKNLELSCIQHKYKMFKELGAVCMIGQ